MSKHKSFSMLINLHNTHHLLIPLMICFQIACEAEADQYHPENELKNLVEYQEHLSLDQLIEKAYQPILPSPQQDTRSTTQQPQQTILLPTTQQPQQTILPPTTIQ